MCSQVVSIKDRSSSDHGQSWEKWDVLWERVHRIWFSDPRDFENWKPPSICGQVLQMCGNNPSQGDAAIKNDNNIAHTQSSKFDAVCRGPCNFFGRMVNIIQVGLGTNATFV